MLNVVDELTREDLASEVERAVEADGVIACWEGPGKERGYRLTTSGVTATGRTPSASSRAPLLWHRPDRCPWLLRG